MADDLALNASSQKKMIMVLLFLESLLRETLSPDAIELAKLRTVDRATELGIGGDETLRLLERLENYAKARQAEHPLASLF